MFNTVTISIDHRKDIITLKGTFGKSFKNKLERKYLNKKKLKQLFIDINPFHISFYGFFAIEVRILLMAFLENENERFIRTVDNAITVLSNNTWLADIDKEYPDTFDYSIIKQKLKFDILEHQKEWFSDYSSIKHKMHYRGRLLAADPGTGKTFSALALCELLNSNKVLIVVPKPSVDTVWINSLTETVYKQPQSYYVYDSKVKYNGEKFIIINYEALNKISKFINEIKGKDTTIILDESHNMNELKSNRTTLFLHICNAVDSDNILLLSGTPIKARPMEMLPMLELLDRRFTTLVKQRYIKIYRNVPPVLSHAITERYTSHRTKVEKKELGLKPVITKSIEIKLKNAKEYTLDSIKLKMIEYVKVRKKELLDDFDKYTHTYTTLYEKVKADMLYSGIKEEFFKEYENAIKKIIYNYKKGTLRNIPDYIAYANRFEKTEIEPRLDSSEKVLFREAKTVVKYLNLKLQGEVLGKVVGKERIRCHVDLAKAIKYDDIINSTTSKTIIFTNYIDVGATAYDTLTKLGYTPARVYGDYTKDLTSTVDKYMVPNNGINPMVATYKSLSTAVPLIVANVMIIIDQSFRSYTYEQTIARINRLGQTKQVYVYQTHLDTGGVPNINSRNIDIIKWSQDMVAYITGDEVDIEILNNEGTTDGLKTIEISELLSNVSIEEKEKVIIEPSTIYIEW